MQKKQADKIPTTPRATNELETRQNAVLAMTKTIKDIIWYKLNKNLTAGELCGLTRALERVNEIETTILTSEKGSQDQQNALTILCAAITGAAQQGE